MRSWCSQTTVSCSTASFTANSPRCSNEVLYWYRYQFKSTGICTGIVISSPIPCSLVVRKTSWATVSHSSARSLRRRPVLAKRLLVSLLLVTIKQDWWEKSENLLHRLQHSLKLSPPLSGRNMKLKLCWTEVPLDFSERCFRMFWTLQVTSLINQVIWLQTSESVRQQETSLEALLQCVSSQLSESEVVPSGASEQIPALPAPAPLPACCAFEDFCWKPDIKDHLQSEGWLERHYLHINICVTRSFTLSR